MKTSRSDIVMRHFGERTFDGCHVVGKELKITTDRSNLWMSHYDSPDEEHFRIALPMWEDDGVLIVNAHSDKRRIGLVIDADGRADLYVESNKEPLELVCDR